MVEADKDGMYNREWAKTLVTAGVFEGDPNQWRITEDNYRRVL